MKPVHVFLAQRHIVLIAVQLRKADMVKKNQEGRVRAERDVLKSAPLVSSLGGAEWISDVVL
jgi:hypothetical protein